MIYFKTYRHNIEMRICKKDFNVYRTRKQNAIYNHLINNFTYDNSNIFKEMYTSITDVYNNDIPYINIPKWLYGEGDVFVMLMRELS